jgi:serine carboxypeptidase 1
LWGDCENVVEDVTFGVNFYNILDRSGDQLVAADASERRQLKYKITRHLKAFQSNSLSQLMNGPLKKKLGIPSSVTWGGQGGQVFTYLSGDFMQSVVPTVDTLLSRGTKDLMKNMSATQLLTFFPVGINVFVYSGNLDLICCTTGTLDWMERSLHYFCPFCSFKS